MTKRITLVVALLVLLLLTGASVHAQTPPAIRTAPVAGANDRTDQVHVLIGSNELITPEFLARHTAQSNGGSWGNNTIVADLFYDGATRSILGRSLTLTDVDDPADLRLGRAVGTYPNKPDFRGRHDPGTVVGHIGFVGWGSNGFTAYQTAIQGATIDETTGILCLSAATGKNGRTRSGSRYKDDDLICHVALHPDGTLVIGANTDPAQTPIHSLIVRGNLMLEGNLEVGGSLNIGGTVTAKDFIKVP